MSFKLNDTLKKIIPLLLIPPLFLIGYFVVSLVTESRENDSMPIRLTDSVKLKQLDSYPSSDTLTDGSECSEANEKLEAFIFAISSRDTKREKVKCKVFELGDRHKIYYLSFPSLVEGNRLILVSERYFEEAIAYQVGYPGNKLYEVKGDGQRLIFKYSGWNNPEKVIELSRQ